jgi:murein DD-endopeptidase MepM/ murein hydrolase activator NlpD
MKVLINESQFQDLYDIITGKKTILPQDTEESGAEQENIDILSAIYDLIESGKEFQNQENSSGDAPYDTDVEKIQTALQFLGYSLPVWGVDGRFGNETEAAVRNFEESAGLGDDGTLDKKDLEVMFKELMKGDFQSYDLNKIQKQQTASLTNTKELSYNPSNGFKTKSRPRHKGVDFKAKKGEKIVLKQGGTVKRVHRGCVEGPKRCGGGYGNFVEVQHDPSTLTRYAHLIEPFMQSGDEVNVGDVVGTVGNTGHSFGAHLHFEFEKDGTKINGAPYADQYFGISLD